MDGASSPSDVPRVFCWICQEHHALSRTIALSSCGHRFCVSCLSSHLTMQLLTGEKTSTCCYRLESDDTPCNTAIDEEDAMKLLAPDIWRLYLTRNGGFSTPAGDTKIARTESASQHSGSSLACRCGRRDLLPQTQLSSCGHRYCIPCLASLVTQSIVEGHISWSCTSHTSDSYAIRLGRPHALQLCGAAIAYQDMKAVLCPYVWAKFQWLTWLKSNPEGRTCGFTEFLSTSKLVPSLKVSNSESMASASVDESQPSVECPTSTSIPILTDELEGPLGLIAHDTFAELEAELPDTFFCQVCMESRPVSRKVDLRGCGHSFCQQCIAMFLETGIRGGRVEFTCFSHIEGEGPSSSRLCAVPITSSDVERLVAAPSWAKYSRFILLKSSDRARECPFCLTTQVTTATPEDPQCVCSSCGEVFCLSHSNAHSASEACEEYEKRQPRLEKRSKVQVKKISKPCPGCKRPIERAGGCMHMTCSVCNANFCWLCCEPWTNSYTHFDPFESTGCRYTYKHRIEAFSSDSRLVQSIAYVLLYTTMIVFGVPAAILFAVCRLFVGKTTTAAIASMVIRAVAIFITAFVLRTAVVLGIICEGFFGLLWQLAKALCTRCSPEHQPKHTETWLPLATPHT